MFIRYVKHHATYIGVVLRNITKKYNKVELQKIFDQKGGFNIKMGKGSKGVKLLDTNKTTLEDVLLSPMSVPIIGV